MRLDEYQWSRNPRGLHVRQVLVTPLDFGHWTYPQMGWTKLVAAGFEYVDDAATFLSLGITPVLRLYVERGGANPFYPAWQDYTRQYLSAGVKWFEFYNEPNLPIEWPPGNNLTYRNFDGMIKPLMDNWLPWAEWIITNGGYPGFPALAETDDSALSSPLWMDAFLGYLKSNYFERFKAILNNGLYCATHPYVLNHYSQEIPGQGATSARPPEQQNGDEDGWHFEYPYDPICQKSDPGRTVYGGTRLTPYGDPVGLTAMGRMFNERCAEIWGSQAIPVVGTEGGVWPLPEPGQPDYVQRDTRYPGYTRASQAEATLAMFRWIATDAPDWFFGVSLWKEDLYWDPNPTHATERLARAAPILKAVPATEVMGNGSPAPTTHGEPDFHFIILAPGLELSWFYNTAQAYWNVFRPIVTQDWSFIGYLPADKYIAVTVIAPPEMAQYLQQALPDQYPNMKYELIPARGDLQTVADLFNSRVLVSRRFG